MQKYESPIVHYAFCRRFWPLGICSSSTKQKIISFKFLEDSQNNWAFNGYIKENHYGQQIQNTKQKMANKIKITITGKSVNEEIGTDAQNGEILKKYFFKQIKFCACPN